MQKTGKFNAFCLKLFAFSEYRFLLSVCFLAFKQEKTKCCQHHLFYINFRQDQEDKSNFV